MGTGGEMTPDEKEARRAPRPVPPDPQAAWRVERSVVRLFDAQRKALREYWVYTKRGKDETEDHYRDRVRRKLKMPRWMFDQDLERARVELRRTLRQLYGLPL